MKGEWLVKTFALGVVVLFITINIQSVFAVDIKTKNVTIILDGEIGENGWFISCVNITFEYNPEEIDLIYFKLDNADWSVYFEMFQVCEDGGHKILWYCIDVNGTQSEVEELDFRIDKTAPEISISYEVIGGNPLEGWTICFTAMANDETSGLNRVEFYLDDVLQETVNGSGPIYQWIYHLSSFSEFRVTGLIFNPEITDEYVEFFAILVIILRFEPNLPLICVYAYDNAGNIGEDWIEQPCPMITISPGVYLFKNLSFPNNYEGYIGKFFIKATFDV